MGKQLEVGDKCPWCKEGVLVNPEPENCSCHLGPPCGSCIEASRAVVCDNRSCDAPLVELGDK